MSLVSVGRLSGCMLVLVGVAVSAVGMSGAGVVAGPPAPSPPSQPPPDPNAPGAPLAPAPGRPPSSSAPPLPRCTVNGKAGNDTLRGTARPDVICGKAGNDRLYARGGDVLVGGVGRDTIYARNGQPDYIVGGTARDRAIVDPGGIDSLTGVERIDGLRRLAHNPSQQQFEIRNKGWSRHAWTGRLYFTGGGGFCSGALVARNVVLTAGHCLYSSATGVCIVGSGGSYNADYGGGGVTFRLDQWGGQSRGDFRSRDAVVSTPWFNAMNNCESGRTVGANSYHGAYDYGYVVLRPDASGRNAGDVAGGWFAIAPEYQGVWFWSIGYSSDGWFSTWGGNYPYFVVSRLGDSARAVGPSGGVGYEVGKGSILTGGGSGGPWIVDANNDGRWNEVAGVNSHIGGLTNEGQGINMWAPWLTRYAVELLNYALTL